MKPSFEYELRAHTKGYKLVAGLDEVGRGCLAGPVVAAAVILDPQNIPKGLNDSKKLTAEKRETLDGLIRKHALAFAIGIGDVEEIDRINILNSSKMAMIRALEQLKPAADCLLIDGNFRIAVELPQLPIVKGDQISVSIAAASIIAKVYRDALMKEHDKLYPGYFWSQNKGYGSVEHRLGLEKLGQSPLHRRSFSWTPVSKEPETVL